MKGTKKEPSAADGAILQHVRKHEIADPQVEKGSQKAGVVKSDDRTTYGRHIVVENGFEAGKRRADAIAAARKASESNLVSLRQPHHVQNENMEGKRGRVPFAGKKKK
jgi:hypothetical protein